ncbi:MAG: rhodanese-like domain-containing protein [Flavobacteriaceae bacterium]|nr:rhodanese-like domain-containing protein [Flavobacteriaceae bacterium]
MKSFTTKIAFLLILSFSVINCAENKKSDTNTTTGAVSQEQKVVSLISPKDLNEKNNEIQLVDVRTPEEYAEGYIKNATNIDFFDDDFAKNMAKLNKSKAIYIYCRGGKRSAKASKQLEEMGFTKVYDLQGGFLNWEKNNLEVEK